MSANASLQSPKNEEILAQALLRAAKALGLSQSETGRIIGKDRSSMHRGGIEPASKAGELASLVIRCYRSLHVLMGGDGKLMKHWMHTRNTGTGGIPAEQVVSIPGLMRVLEYLEAMRAKI